MRTGLEVSRNWSRVFRQRDNSRGTQVALKIIQLCFGPVESWQLLKVKCLQDRPRMGSGL